MSLGIPIPSGFRDATPEETKRLTFSYKEAKAIRAKLDDIERCQAYAKAHAHECWIWR